MTALGRRFALAAAPVGLATAAIAQPLEGLLEEPAVEQYAVELVVFRHANAPAEPFLEPPDEPVIEDAEVPAFGDTAAVAEPKPFVEPLPEPRRREPLPEDAHALTDLVARLQDLGAYEPLLHAGWIQDSYPIGDAPAFHVEAAEHPGLTGTVAFSRGRYSHLELDLSYRPAELADMHPAWAGFNVSESRRLRDDEVHYFDHPQFGVIARVAPWPPEGYEEALPAAPADDAAALDRTR